MVLQVVIEILRTLAEKVGQGKGAQPGAAAQSLFHGDIIISVLFTVRPYSNKLN
jgi:hypothetical protein